MFGQTHLSLSPVQYTLVLGILGSYCGVALPACVVVVRARTNIIREIRGGGGGGCCQII